MPCTATVGWNSPKPPRSTVLLLSSSRQAKPTRGLKLFLSVLISVSGRPTSSAVSVRPSARSPGGSSAATAVVGHHVMTAIDGDEVGERQSFSCQAPTSS